jgi:hypothetical protein
VSLELVREIVAQVVATTGPLTGYGAKLVLRYLEEAAR